MYPRRSPQCRIIRFLPHQVKRNASFGATFLMTRPSTPMIMRMRLVQNNQLPKGFVQWSLFVRVVARKYSIINVPHTIDDTLRLNVTWCVPFLTFGHTSL